MTAKHSLVMEPGLEAGAALEVRNPYPPGDLAIWIFILAELLVFALFKGHLIGDWFMGLRGVRGPWRWVVVIWLLIPASLITYAFALSY